MIELKLATRPLAMSTFGSSARDCSSCPSSVLSQHFLFCLFFFPSLTYFPWNDQTHCKQRFFWPWPLQNMRQNTFGFTTDPRDKWKAFCAHILGFHQCSGCCDSLSSLMLLYCSSNPSFFPESGYGSLAERLSSGEPFLIHLFGSNMKKCRLKTWNNPK